MNRTSSALVGGVLLLLVGIVLGWGMKNTWSADSDLRGASKKLRQAYETIRTRYVEPVSPDTLTAWALRELVASLDPHSAYIDRERMERIRETFEGSFEGIGISYELIDGPQRRPGQDTIFVSTVVPGGPSEEAGLLPGDRIVAVEGTSAVGWSRQRIRSRLTGPEGTAVQVKVRRPGRRAPFRTTIVRDQVPLRTLEAAYMMDDTTGYLRLQRFARTTHQELTQGLRQLEEAGMRRLILDLRGNAGGLMAEAEEVADEFLVEDQLIVTARSKHNGYSEAWHAEAEGAFEDGPLIVLVDEHSASASEIVAGALQGHDRALIVGRRTFGKGLVQRQFGFDDGSGLRLTVARFYTPSGRLLQRPYETSLSRSTGADVDSSESSRGPDSLVYRTDAGRRVKGGGGIWPDRVVDRETTESSFRTTVERRGLIRPFARKWLDARADSLRARWGERPDSFATAFALPSSVVPAFIQYAEAQGVAAPSQQVEAAALSAEKRPEPTAHGSAPTARPSTESVPRRALRILIRSYVGRRLFGTSMWVRVRNTIDPVVSTAQRSWGKAEELASRYPVEESP